MTLKTAVRTFVYGTCGIFVFFWLLEIMSRFQTVVPPIPGERYVISVHSRSKPPQKHFYPKSKSKHHPTVTSCTLAM